MAQAMEAGGNVSTGLKPILSGSKILQMNLGFLGLQFSFGLQQANMTPIWAYLGADEASFPWLGIAGPLTGLIVQPIIGVMSDRTLSKYGRRTPYFLIGAIMCMLCARDIGSAGGAGGGGAGGSGGSGGMSSPWSYSKSD